MELDDALGSWCFGVFPRLGWMLGALWRIFRRLLGAPFLRGWLRGVRRRRLWNARLATKRCRRRSMLSFAAGPLAGVGGVFFTPLAVGLPAAMMGSSVAGSLQAGVA